MNDRREPTISGMRIDPEDARLRKTTRQNGTRPAQPTSARAGAPSPQRPVIVKSKLTGPALFLALVGLAAAGGLGWQLFEMQKQLVDAQMRVAQLEEKLVMSDDETTASAAAMQASLKEAHSEIRKLWGVAYDKNRKAIADNKSGVSAAKTQAANAKKSADSLKSDISRVEGLVKNQNTAMSNIEESAAIISSQARALNEKNARTEQKLATVQEQLKDIEQDIEAINGFRRSVNQQILQLKGAAAAP